MTVFIDSLPRKPAPLEWWQKPGGSVHAFGRGISSLCGRFYFQASWSKPAADGERCPVCQAMSLVGAG